MTYPIGSYVVGIVFVASSLLIGYFMRTPDPSRRPFAFLFGEDGRRSTSKLPPFVWLMALVGAFAMLLWAAVWRGWSLADIGLDQLGLQYLVLIGAPLATALVARGVVQSKVKAGTLQKTRSAVPSGGLLSDDRGRADLVDIQYLSFHGVLLMFFVVSVIAKPVLPQLPDLLLGLTGASAAAFVTNKAIAANPPTIAAVTAGPPSRGDSCTVRIRGLNLYGPVDLESSDTLALVGIDGTAVKSVTAWSSDGTRVDVVVVPVPTPGSTVSVTTIAGTTAVATVPGPA